MRHACAVIVLLLAAGCYSYVPAEVHVFEADTGRAMPGQTIRPIYLRNFNLFVPDMSPTSTNAEGVARLKLCTNYDQGLPILKLGEPGYFGDPGPSRSVQRQELLREDRRAVR